jgi:hypothetical protein
VKVKATSGLEGALDFSNPKSHANEIGKQAAFS